MGGISAWGRLILSNVVGGKSSAPQRRAGDITKQCLAIHAPWRALSAATESQAGAQVPEPAAPAQ